MATDTQLSGLERMRAIQTGEAPPAPIAGTLGFELVEVEEGRAVFAAEPDERHLNPLGTVHGGLVATLLDSALGCAVHTTLPAGLTYTSLDLKLNFVRPLSPGMGRVVCEGTVVHPGRRVATAEGRVVHEATGKLLAHGLATCLVMPAA